LSKAEDPDFEKIDAGHASMYELAKVLFEEGKYVESLTILKELERQELKEDIWLKVTWARIYCEILSGNNGIKPLDTLKRKIEELEADDLAF
jgi:replicative DNA helicase